MWFIRVGLFSTIIEGTSPAVKGFEVKLQIAIVSIIEVLTLSFSLTLIRTLSRVPDLFWVSDFVWRFFSTFGGLFSSSAN